MSALLSMKRVMPGLYQGADLRAERVRQDDGRYAWRFDIRGQGMTRWHPSWVEHRPAGDWRPIGTWSTLATGEAVAVQLRAGTHFWDGNLGRTRAYGPEVYEEIANAEPEREDS